MSDRICRECKEDGLEIMGTGGFGDLIEVECRECGAYYEVEPDGLGDGGLEMIEAMCIDEGLDCS
jgi:hypothetical protein